MQKGMRTTRCEYWKFARRDVWAHQQCFLRWNGNNRHGCPPLHLETFVCQHTSCTNTNELRFVTLDKESSMSTLWQEKESEQTCSRIRRTQPTRNMWELCKHHRNKRERRVKWTYYIHNAYAGRYTRVSCNKQYVSHLSWSLFSERPEIGTP